MQTSIMPLQSDQVEACEIDLILQFTLYPTRNRSRITLCSIHQLVDFVIEGNEDLLLPALQLSKPESPYLRVGHLDS